ncbi:undecaprenyl-diphosphatase UppP [Patescibacteria group bacterium]|nr:undecaprenyl-diphosphatase UppP [Patescibacteria group bacterium]
MQPSLLIAAVLGLVQGLTEFIPISSSGHLVIVRELTGWADQGNLFDAVLHLATLFAILLYFWRDWVGMITAVFKKAPKREARFNRRLFWLIVVATLPALILGLWLEPWIGMHFRGLLPVASLMLVSGVIFWLVDHRVNLKHDLTRLSPARALGIGLAQALAMLPGISRSGTTIVTGLYMELSREAAAKFSFLIAAPIIALAGGYSLYQAIQGGALNLSDYLFWLTAFGVSFVAGLLAIRFLMSFLKKYSLDIFAYYLVIVGLGLIGWHFLG